MADSSAPEPSAISDGGGQLPEIDSSGVDLTLIRETLRLTPTDRLRALESYMNRFASVKVIRRASDDSTSKYDLAALPVLEATLRERTRRQP